MMIYRNLQTNQVQEIGEWETVRRQILESAGWVAEIGDDLVVLAPDVQPIPAPGYTLVEVTDMNSQIREFIEVPEDAAPKRKRSK